MIDLSQEQKQRLEAGQAVDVVDPQTAEEYVVLRKEVFARVRRFLYDDSEWTHDELRLMLARSAAENGWEEPGMEAYDHYDAERQERCQ